MKHDDRTLAITVAICAVLQIMVAPNIRIAQATPNFLLIAVVATAIMKGPRVGCTTGFIAGLVFDLITTGPFGAMAAILTVVGFGVGYFARGLILESTWMTLVLLAFCALFAEFLYLLLLAIVGDVPAFGTALYTRMLPSALYDIVFACIGFPLMKHFITPLASHHPDDSPLG